MRLNDEIRRVRGNERRETFAQRAGVTYQTVRRWELGQAVPATGLHIDFLVNEGVDRSLIESTRAQRLSKVAS